MTAAILVLGSFAAVQGIKLDQLTLLVAGSISLCAFFLTTGQLFLGGVVLAVSTIKPQLVGPLVACLLLWAITDWRCRKHLVWGFGTTMAALLLASEAVLPGWIRKFLIAVHEYVSYTGGTSLIDRLLFPGSGRTVSAAIIAILLALAWRVRRAEPGSREFAFLLAKILAATLLIVPTFAPYNQMILLPAVLLTAREWSESWRAGAIPKAMLAATVLALGWPWVAAIGLALASLRVPITALDDVLYAPLYTVLAIPFVLLLDLAVLSGTEWFQESPAPARLAMSDGKL
jgi:TM2 domain-containing membrane protein YozV